MMPFVAGFLRVRRRPGRPGHPLPPGERPVDPDYGIEEGERPEVEPPDPEELPDPPPGIWPGPTPTNPIVPVPPGDMTPPGTIWPPPGTPGHPIHSEKFWIVAGIPGYGWRYVCVDPSLLVPAPAPHS